MREWPEPSGSGRLRHFIAAVLTDKMRRLLLIAGVLSAVTVVARGHHGRDFLLMQDYSIPVPFHGVITGGFSAAFQQPEDEMEMETGVFAGVAPRTGLGMNVKGGDHGEGWDFSAVAPYVQVQLTPPKMKFPVRVALIAGWQYAVNREAGGHDHGGGHSHEVKPVAVKQKVKRKAAAAAAPAAAAADPAVPCGPDYGPDAPPCDDPAVTTPHDHSTHDHGDGAVSAGHDDGHEHGVAGESGSGVVTDDIFHAHGGIHQHGVNQWFGRLIVETDLTAADKVLFNLLAVMPEGGKAAWGYAGGYRHAFSHVVALGVEAIGDFGEANQHELMAGAYLAPTHAVLVRLGAGFGLTRESADFTLRAGLVWRF